MKRPLLLSLPVLLLALAGCSLLPAPQPDTTRYYVLAAPAAPAAEPAPGAVRLGLRPVELPDYLRHKSLAVRRGQHEIGYAADARWAEPLDAGLARVLRERLAAQARVAPHPFPALAERDYDVTVRVLAADGTSGGVRFSAVFEIARAGGEGGWLVRREFNTSGSDWGGDHGRLAAELSAATVALADEILAALPPKP
jgi:uncharacterized lipoprotein YmbA